MTYLTPWLPPSDTANSRVADNRTFILERRSQFMEMVIPFAWVGGTAQFAGYVAQDTTTLSEAFRSDVIVTAPVLQYDFQLSTAFGSGVTSVNYEIKVYASASEFATTVLLTGTGSSGDQLAGYIDLFSAVGPDIFTRYASFRLSVSRNGGSGDGAGVRMIKPWLLRSPVVLA
jgi:hypothetical protein